MLIAGLLVLASEPESTPELPVELDWQAPDGCPDREAVLETVREHAVSFAELARPIRARAHIESASGEYAVHLVLDGEDGSAEHDLSSPDCGVVANATAFMIAVAMDPVAKAEESSARPPEESEAPAEPAPEPSPPAVQIPEPRPAPREPTPTESTSARLQGALAAAPGVQVGHLGPAGPFLEVDGGVRLRWLQLGALATYAPPLTRSLPGGTGTLQLQQWMLGGRVCALPTAAQVEFPVCVSLAGGRIHGRTAGIGVTASDSQHALSAAVTAGLGWSPRPRVAVGLRAQSWLNPVRGRFEVGGLGVVYRVPWVSGTAQAVVELRFGGGADSHRGG